MCNEKEPGPVRKKGWEGVFRLVFICLLGFQLSSCSFLSPSVQQGPVLSANTQELLELLRTRRQALQTVKGLFSAQIQGPGIPITQTIHGTMIFQDPQLLRIKGFTRFGGSLFDFSLGQNQYVLSLPREGKMLSGSLEELQRNPDVEKPIVLTVLAMSGVTGIETVTMQEEAVLLEEEDHYLLEVYAFDDGHVAKAAPRRRIWFDRRTLYVIKEERIGSSGSVDASLQLDDFRKADPVVLVAGQNGGTGALRMPFHIMAQDGEGAGRITVKFTELQPNVPVTDKDFSFTRSSLAR